MCGADVTAELVEGIGSGGFYLVVCNIANPDMVGHSGDVKAAIQAAEAVDVAIGAVDAAVREVGGALVVTADPGNLEMTRDPATGPPPTAHTASPVPLVYAGERWEARRAGKGCVCTCRARWSTTR